MHSPTSFWIYSEALFYRHISSASMRYKETFLQGSIEGECHKKCNNFISYIIQAHSFSNLCQLKYVMEEHMYLHVCHFSLSHEKGRLAQITCMGCELKRGSGCCQVFCGAGRALKAPFSGVSFFINDHIMA